jgi:glucose uptake protein
MLGSTFIYAPFFITFAVHGAPVQLRAYFKGGAAQHFYGLFAGVLWSAGMIGAFVSGGTLATIQVDAATVRGFADGAGILGALWGLAAWREFRGAEDRVRILLIAMLILWVVGAGIVIVAPTLAK